MQVEIDVRVELESPLHIGSGSLADSLADKPIIKDARGLALVPGSALKGKVRHAAEQIARGLGRRVCDAPYPDRMCKADNLCLVCRIFGAPEHPAAIRFGSLTLEPADAWPKDRGWASLFDSDVRAGVGLSRARRTAQEDLLYTVETWRGSPALTLRGAVRGELAEIREAALLAAALRAVRTLGGNRSRGLGWCSIVPTVRLDGIEQDVATLIKELAAWTS